MHTISSTRAHTHTHTLSLSLSLSLSLTHTHTHIYIYIYNTIHNKEKHSQLKNTHILLLESEIHRKSEREER